MSSLYIKNSSTKYKECVCRYILKAAFNFAVSFWRIVALSCKLLKQLCQHRMYFIENKIGWHLAFEDCAHSLY